MAGLYELLKAKFDRGEMPFDAPLSKEELDGLPWYYTIELSPGRFTAGETYSNVALTRELLSRCDVDGQGCLDIGTMEGLIPTLLARRNARHVVAYDRMRTLAPRLDIVKRAYGVDFEVITGGPITDLRNRLHQTAFDIVVISGVIYHQMDPFSGLAAARGLVRDGGLLIVESSAIVSSEMAALFNAAGRFGVHAYFLICLPALDYMLRFLRLSVIDCLYIPSHQVGETSVCRVAVTCRAERQAPGERTDEFVRGSFLTEADLAEFIDWRALRSDAAPVPYRTDLSRTRRHAEFNSVDIYETVTQSPAFDYSSDKAILHLSDRQ